MQSAPDDPHGAEAGPLFAFLARARGGTEAVRRTEQDLAQQLTALLGDRVTVRFTRARTYPVQTTREPNGQRHVKLHGFFAEAPTSTVEDLARWLRAGRRARAATARLDAYLEREVARLGPKSLPARLVTRGAHHDLKALRDELGSEPTAGPIHYLAPEPALSFGRFASRRPRRRLLLGSFDSERRWVRVHPLLDSAQVPDFFVRYVLFHELLHAALPLERTPSGRIAHHGPLFRAAERTFCETRPALAWERANQDLLFRLARAGRTA